MNLTKRTINSLQQRIGRFTQSENSRLVYRVNYAAQLGSDTIAQSSWVVEFGALTLAGDTYSGPVTEVVVSGDPGEHLLNNTITTSTGEVIERMFKIKITANDLCCESDYGVPC